MNRTTLTFSFLWKSLCICLIFSGLSSYSVQAQTDAQSKEWTLQEVIQYALDHNIDIQQALLGVDEAEIDKSDALGNYLPDVNAGISNSWNSGLTQNITTGILEQQTTRNFSVNATASFPIFHGLRNLKEWQRAKMTRLSSEYSLELMKDDILLNVTNAYLNVIVNKERLKVLEEQNELTKSSLARMRVMIEEGAAPAGDSLDIRATYANERQQIIQAKNDIKISSLLLAQLLQINDYSNFKIADADYDVPLETLLDRNPQDLIENARENRYEIKMAEQDLELAKKDVEIAKTDFLPHLDGYVNFNTRESDRKMAMETNIPDPDNPYRIIGAVEGTGENVISPNYMIEEFGSDPFFKQLSKNKGWEIGLRLNIPILNGFQTRNAVKRSKITIARREHDLLQAELDLESSVYQAYVDAQGAGEAYRAALVAVDAQERSFEYTKDKYDVGKITSFEFSQAKFELTDAESKLINSKYDYIFKLKVLELYFGVAPEDLNLN